MPILQQNALVTIYLKAFLLTITSINTSYATKPSSSNSDYLSKCNNRANSNNYGGLCSHIFSALCR
ncbi:UNVERIFIED_CONTAM: hypothetical protein LBW93_03390 [Wolbachia endosymbiont of Nasonia longicornis]